MKSITIEIPRVAPGLNGSKGLKNMHFQAYRKLRDSWAFEIRSLTNAKFKGRVSIDYTRSSVVPMDWDNLSASFKVIGDALVSNNIIEDDNPTIVVEFRPHWRKAKNNSDLKTIITITQT
jgi:hypothetical protein